MGSEGVAVAGVRLKACVFIGLAVHALIYILLIFKFDLYRGACGGGRGNIIYTMYTYILKYKIYMICRFAFFALVHDDSYDL